ncbi:MAG: hypothetical protein ABI645_04950 [Pseudomonadota bacterium]
MILLLACILIADGAVPAPAADGTGYAVVDGVVTFRRIKGGDPNGLYPWERAELERQRREERRQGEMETVVISNGGSPVDFTYSLYRLGNTAHPQYWRARGLLGEWGRVGEFILESPHLVKYRKWKGTSYMLESVLLLTDGAHQLFVGDQAFISEQGWSGLVRQVANPEEGTACRAEGALFLARERALRDEGATAKSGGPLCVTQGVYLKDIDAQLLANRHDDRKSR